MFASKRQRTDDGYETDKTVPDDSQEDCHHYPQDELHNSLLQEIEALKTEAARLTGNLRTMPPTPPTVRINKSTGDSLYVYAIVNNLYTGHGQKYTGPNLYEFRPLTTRDVDYKNVPVYDINGTEIERTNLFGVGGKRRRTTHRKASKRGGNKKSCKRTKKR